VPVLGDDRLRLDRALHEGHVLPECRGFSVHDRGRMRAPRALHGGRVLREQHGVAVLGGGGLWGGIELCEWDVQLR
jgi:hypothetical protein